MSALEAFKPIAERHSALAVAPFFSEEDYPSSEDYTLGVGVDDTPYGRVYDPDEWRAPENYIHSEIEHLFEAIKMQYNSPQCDYRIFGHSAGAQFTHRLLTFRSDARVVRAVAANSGWYTLPSDGGGDDPNFYMPYGLQGSPVTDDDVRQAFGKELVVLLGSEDTVECFDDPDLRDTDEAVFQGITRLERGLFYFSLARVQSLLLNTELAWLNDIVLGACHDKDEMSPSGGWYLFRDEDEVPCIPSTVTEAGALVINEILADPPSDLAGDANNDGIRDSNDDEFVELVNAGTTAVCLTGWTLGDAEDPGRHRFPVSSRLAPGEAMVVFGNGIPTGAFGGSIVQWAAFGGRLNMSNDGDVLTLADHAGTIHSQVSWGDCDRVDCAPEHISGDLGIDQSVVRSPELTGDFVPHIAVAPEALYSSGVQADGTPFTPDDVPPPIGYTLDTAATASSLVINELLADPPSDLAVSRSGRLRM